MNKHRSLLASLFVLVLGVVLWGGGCASGGGTSASGDDGGSDGTSPVTDASGDSGGCTGGKTKCGGKCVSTGTDPKNCGKCGTVCTSAQVCSQGACAAGCGTGETMCGGSMPSEAGAPSEAGSGADSSASGDDGGGAADTGTAPVDSGSSTGDAGAPYCANLNNDPNNCGGCGITCAGGAGACTNGTCATPTCPAGQVGCAASGTCIPTGTCCNTGQCSVTGAICPMPGGQCQCPTGENACMALMACISASACCDATDCNKNGATGQTCPTPGQACTCPTTLQCCQGSDCPAEPNVATAACSTNKCIATCNAGCYDLNSTYSDGCECCDTPNAAHSCTSLGAPTAVTIGGSVSFNGTIPEPSGGDWYAVSFAASPTTSTVFHPAITLSANPNTEFVFEVLAGACTGTPLACVVESGSATSDTTWETQYGGPNAPSPAGDPTSVTSGGVSNFQPIASVGTVYIHVFRASMSAPATCDQYTLTVTE